MQILKADGLWEIPHTFDSKIYSDGGISDIIAPSAHIGSQVRSGHIRDLQHCHVWESTTYCRRRYLEKIFKILLNLKLLKLTNYTRNFFDFIKGFSYLIFMNLTIKWGWQQEPWLYKRRLIYGIKKWVRVRFLKKTFYQLTPIFRRIEWGSLPWPLHPGRWDLFLYTTWMSVPARHERYKSVPPSG